MYSKLSQQIDQHILRDTLEKREIQIQAWRTKIAIKQQRRNFQKQLFGQHYNYSKVGLNKQKKYLIEEQRNTQIQRSNRILLEKIQRISKRSVPMVSRKRIFTQQEQTFFPRDKHSNMQGGKGQYQTSNINKSYDQLEKIRNNQFKSTKSEVKLLYKGSKKFEGKLVLIKTYIANGKFTIASDFGRTKQKIYVQLDQYRMFFNDVLEADHSKIVDYLEYKGQVLQIAGIRKQNTTIQQREEVILPQLLQKLEAKKNNRQDSKSQYSQILI